MTINISPVKAKKRPGFLRALGREEPPEFLEIEGQVFRRGTVFKHDSWAATAVYECGPKKLVCKLNRQSPLLVVPMKWLGIWLGQREFWFLQRLQGIDGIPRSYRVHSTGGQWLRHACAHDFIDGTPMSGCAELPAGFIDRLENLLAELHRRQVAYVDLHKQENVIVGDDGNPWLIDFQISAFLPDLPLFRSLFAILAESDRYHVAKHAMRRGLASTFQKSARRPWWIRLHRLVAVPFRTARRRLLVLLGVRKGTGSVSSELAPEIGLQK